MVEAIMSSTFMSRSLIEEPEEEHDSDVSDLDEDDETRRKDDEPILAPRRVVKEPKSLQVSGRKPYLQQTESTKQETMRKMEVSAVVRSAPGRRRTTLNLDFPFFVYFFSNHTPPPDLSEQRRAHA
ncbi:hypothetical protein N9L76_08210 [bacterium]|nr:hypothetical protein [bacterium]|tara:strand:+ start:269 stop:646 length:378 start_codon:yes stop_codon:yes gene_type:complete